MDLKELIGIRIGAIRRQKGMTQEELSGRMEISSKYLSSIERGKENPTLDTLISLSKCMEVNISELFTCLESEDPVKQKSLLTSLLKDADNDQLRLALRILSAVIKTKQ